MRKRVAVAWLPVAVVLVLAGYWVGQRRAGGLSKQAEPAKPEAPTGEPDERVGASESTTPEPEPSTPTPGIGPEVSTAHDSTPTAYPPREATPPAYPPRDATEGYGMPGEEARAATPGVGSGLGAAEGEGTPRGYGEGESGWDTDRGTSLTDSTYRGYDTSTGTETDTAPTTSTGTGSTYGETEGTTTQVQRELAYAFHLFDGFEQTNSWAVESAADHAEYAVVEDEEHSSEGKKALKATFEARGKGNFELRREVRLDLTQATTLLVDVYNDTGPMDLVVGFRAGYDTTLFTAPPKPLRPGENKDVSFALSDFRTTEGGAFGSSWDYSRDRVSRVSLIFQERAEKKGTVYIDNLRFDRPAAELGAKAKPVVKTITMSGQTIERYELLELTVGFEAEYQRMFDQAEIDVLASFFSPSGKRLDVHGFVHDTDAAAAKPVWKVRFTPDEVGLWRFDVTVKTEGGETTSATRTFLCHRKADRKGFIRRSKHDPRYFEFDDGSFYYPVGQNVCWSTKYDYYLAKIQAYGGNYVRVWLCPWSLRLEAPPQPQAAETGGATTPAEQPAADWDYDDVDAEPTRPLEDPRQAGTYDLRTAKALDELLALCQRRGIYVQLVFRHHGMHDAKWAENPYNAANGGPCTSPGQFFTDTAAKGLHKRFLDYVVARWGHSPVVFAWELWNEADLARADRDGDLVAWHKEMGSYLKKIDVNRHLVTTSVASPSRCFALFELPQIDFVPVHFYAADVVRNIHDHYLRYRELRKPIFISEFSRGVKPADDLSDPRGIHLHAGLWGAWTMPLAGSAMPWWWDTYVDKHELYSHWSALARFARGADRRGRGYELVRSRIKVGDDVWASMQGLVSPAEACLWVYDEARIARPEQAGRPLLFAERAVRLDGMLGGTFRVEIWDTYAGKVIGHSEARTTDGLLSFKLPKCDRDIAVKIARVGSARPRLEW